MRSSREGSGDGGGMCAKNCWCIGWLDGWKWEMY